jgi:hypothetical protein
VRWDGWTTTGHRDVHGMKEEETVLGYQLICRQCEIRYSHAKDNIGGENRSYCFATTNPTFWQKWEHWKIPRKKSHLHISANIHRIPVGNIPHFFKRCAVTHELFNMVIEMRLSSTSKGLAENIKRTCSRYSHKPNTNQKPPLRTASPRLQTKRT